jgi:hypothetical protein
MVRKCGKGCKRRGPGRSKTVQTFKFKKRDNDIPIVIKAAYLNINKSRETNATHLRTLRSHYKSLSSVV